MACFVCNMLSQIDFTYECGINGFIMAFTCKFILILSPHYHTKVIDFLSFTLHNDVKKSSIASIMYASIPHDERDINSIHIIHVYLGHYKTHNSISDVLITKKIKDLRNPCIACAL